MTAPMFFFGLFSTILAFIAWVLFTDEYECHWMLGLLFSVASFFCGSAAWNESKPERIAAHAAEKAAQEALRKANETPHVIREADGCKVYAFLSGDRYHYFTRCKDQTTTDTSWEECRQSGKSRICETKTESVTVTK